MRINPYLNFDGNAEEAFNFYKKVFKSEIAAIQRFKDMPPGPTPVAPDEENRVMHIALPIGNNMLMASDISPAQGHKLTIGNNNYISIDPESKEEGERIFNELSEGGKIEMNWQKMFWGGWFGSFTDKFGVSWMINFQEDPVPANFKPAK